MKQVLSHFAPVVLGDLIIKEDLIVDSIIEALVKASISKCYVKPA